PAINSRRLRASILPSFLIVPSDVVKCIMAGASVAMMASAFLHKGIHHAHTVLADLRRWLEEHEYDSVRQMCGSMSRRSLPDPSAFERGNYMLVLSSYTFRSGSLNK